MPLGSTTAVEASKSEDDLIITDIVSDNVANSMIGTQNQSLDSERSNQQRTILA